MFTEKPTKAHESPGTAVKHCCRVTVQMRSYWCRRKQTIGRLYTSRQHMSLVGFVRVGVALPLFSFR